MVFAGLGLGYVEVFQADRMWKRFFANSCERVGDVWMFCVGMKRAPSSSANVQCIRPGRVPGSRRRGEKETPGREKGAGLLIIDVISIYRMLGNASARRQSIRKGRFYGIVWWSRETIIECFGRSFGDRGGSRGSQCFCWRKVSLATTPVRCDSMWVKSRSTVATAFQTMSLWTVACES